MMRGPAETIASGDFGQAQELHVVIRKLLDDGRRSAWLGRHGVVSIVAPDGRVCHRARLVRERLTDSSLPSTSC